MNEKQIRKINETYQNGVSKFTKKDLEAKVLNHKAEAFAKASKHLSKFFEEFKLLWSLIKDYHSGQYRNVPWSFIASAGFSIFYLLLPFDVFPDIFPVVGYVDDASVFGLVIAGFKTDIETYKAWKNNQIEQTSERGELQDE